MLIITSEFVCYLLNLPGTNVHPYNKCIVNMYLYTIIIHLSWNSAFCYNAMAIFHQYRKLISSQQYKSKSKLPNHISSVLYLDLRGIFFIWNKILSLSCTNGDVLQSPILVYTGNFIDDRYSECQSKSKCNEA